MFVNFRLGYQSTTSCFLLEYSIPYLFQTLLLLHFEHSIVK